MRPDGFDNLPEGDLQRPLDVHRHLRDASAQQHADGADAGKPVVAGLPHLGRDPPGLIQTRGRRELQVERHERRPCRDQRGAGAVVQVRGTEVRAQGTAGLWSSVLHTRAQALQSPAAQLGTRTGRPARCGRELSVKEHRDLQLLADAVGENERVCASRSPAGMIEIYERGDVERADVRMLPGLGLARTDNVDPLDSDARGPHHRVDKRSCGTGGGEHRPVVIGVGVHVEEPDTALTGDVIGERSRERANCGGVAALGRIGHSDQQRSAHAGHEASLPRRIRRRGPRQLVALPYGVPMTREQFDYDDHAAAYPSRRRGDAHIAARIDAALGEARTVVNVGAGAGSYEPLNRHVVAVEPSAGMRAQRPRNLAPAIAASAEALPLDDGAVDAAMATITIHHWKDPVAGLLEMRRVARGPVVVLTVDIDAVASYWLVADYLPELLVLERTRFPTIETITGALPGAQVQEIAIPLDCTDGFVEAFYGRPEAYLEDSVRAAQSAWPPLPTGVEQRAIRALAGDLSAGLWDSRHGHLRTQDAYRGGLRLIVAGPAPDAACG
jgi:SAM-dependent methyltransferase